MKKNESKDIDAIVHVSYRMFVRRSCTYIYMRTNEIIVSAESRSMNINRDAILSASMNSASSRFTNRKKG